MSSCRFEASERRRGLFSAPQGTGEDVWRRRDVFFWGVGYVTKFPIDEPSC